MAEKEYIEREAAYDMDTLYDWFISSVSENDNPVWTEEHLEELLNDFYVIPKDTPSVKAEPVHHGHVIWKRRHKGGFRNVKCLHRFCNFVLEDNAPCKHIAKIDDRYTIDEPYCSECGRLLGGWLNYCGNCGAKMIGAKNDR